MRPMTSFPAKGPERGRLRHQWLLVWAACTGLCANAAWSQTEATAPPDDAAPQDATAPREVDTSAYQQRVARGLTAGVAAFVRP